MRKVLALLALIVSIFTLASCGSTHGASVSNKPVSLVGEWHQVKSDPNGWMTASISGESIQVNLEGRDSSSIYWAGTFDTHKRTTSKYKVISLIDPDAMKYAIISASDKNGTPLKTMPFTYDHGVLSFQFSALGRSTTVHMTKVKSAYIPTHTPTTYRPSVNKPTTQAKKTPGIIKAPKITAPKVSLGKKK